MYFAPICASLIFVAMFVMVVLEKFERQWVTLVSGLCTIILVFGVGMRSFDAFWETMNIHSIFTLEFWYAAGESSESTSGINWATIIFIFGMMVMVEGMARVGFFRWLCMKIAQLVNFKPIPIFITFMVLSACLAMFIDSITVILFLAAVTIELARLLEFNPVPVILTEIFCANLGGSATMCGDPPNIIIGTSLGYTFTDFICNTGVLAAVSLVVTVVYFYFTLRRKIQPDGPSKLEITVDPSSAIVDRKGFVISIVIFACAIIMLITHAQTGLTVALIGIAVALATIVVNLKHIKEIMTGVDYDTLLFFIGLFIVVGGLEQTGVLEIIAEFIHRVSGDNVKLMIAIILFVSAIASAFVDNIPFSATMIPVISNLTELTGVPLTTLAWTLAIGTDIGGSATPIGASANVVGIATAEKEGYKITWGQYCKALAPITVIVMVISLIGIYLRYM